MDEKIIYRLNDDISFRKCTLADGAEVQYGNCTNFQNVERNWVTYYKCNQNGIHLHCTIHPEIELNITSDKHSTYLICPKCNKKISCENYHEILNQCLKMLNIEEFKGAKLVKLDDWYVPEIKKKESLPSDYFITTNVKTDKDSDTIVVVYIGHKGEKEKVQFFIKPEKLQLSHDHKDLDPAKVLSKIEITLKDRVITQSYDDEL